MAEIPEDLSRLSLAEIAQMAADRFFLAEIRIEEAGDVVGSMEHAARLRFETDVDRPAALALQLGDTGKQTNNHVAERAKRIKIGLLHAPVGNGPPLQLLQDIQHIQHTRPRQTRQVPKHQHIELALASGVDRASVRTFGHSKKYLDNCFKK